MSMTEYEKMNSPEYQPREYSTIWFRGNGEYAIAYNIIEEKFFVFIDKELVDKKETLDQAYEMCDNHYDSNIH